MSYRNQQNVTMLSELPDIEDLEENKPSSIGLNMIPSDMGKYQKYIRNNTYNPEQLSGMSTQPNNQYNQYKVGYQTQGSYIDYAPMSPYPPQPQHNDIQYTHANFDKLQSYYEPYEKQASSCIDVANHAANCPVCSKLYNNDRTVYIITIAILCIICILLLKRVLDI
jgi:hypothetical protein